MRSAAAAGFAGEDVPEGSDDVQHDLHRGQTLVEEEEEVGRVVQHRQGAELSHRSGGVKTRA